MELLTQIQLNEAQQEAHLKGEIVRISATWDEFLDFLKTTHYRAEYANHEIIIMGLAKALHEYSQEWTPGTEPYYPVNDDKNGQVFRQ